MIYWTAFLASAIFLFIKSFQYRNVAFDRYGAIIPTSILMAFAEYYVIIRVVQEGLDPLLIGLVGLGAGLGSISATWFHKKFYDKVDGKKTND